jgi:hypothetical protein
MASQSESKTPFREYIGYVLAGISAFIDGNGDGADTASIHNELQDTPQRSIYLPFTFPVAVSYGFLYAIMAVITERELSQAYQKKGEQLKKLQDKLIESKKALKNKIREEFNKLNPQEQTTDEAREIKAWLDDTGHLPTPSNRILLKYLIKPYDVNRLDKEILRLIGAVTGLNYRTASFKKDLEKFLGSSHRRKNPLRAIPKRIFEFISRFSLMASITAYLLILFAAASIPVTWPFIAVIVGSGIIYWAINFIYHRYYNHPRKKQNKDIAKELGLEQILENISNDPAQVTAHVLKDNPPENSLSGPMKGNDPENSLSLSMSQKIRMGLNVTGSFILFLAGSVSGGMTLAYLADIFLATATIISFPVLSGMIGAGLAAFSIYYWIKKRIKEIQVESVLTKEVAARKLELKNLEGFEENIKKNNQELLKDVIGIDNSGKGHIDNRQRKKIIGLIEKSIGMNFSEDNKNLFFDALAKYMGKNNEASVQQFKNKFLNESDSVSVNANNPELNINKFKAFFKGLMNHALPLTGVITLALLTPVFLFGLQALLPIGVIAGVIVAGYLLNKITSHYHQKRMTELKEEKIKYELMEYKYEMQKANQAVPNHVGGQSPEADSLNTVTVEQVSSPTPQPENGVSETMLLTREHSKVFAETTERSPESPVTRLPHFPHK